MTGFLCDEGTLVRYEGRDHEVIIPDSVIAIGGHAFSGNNRMTRVVIPDSVKTIGYQAFSNCTRLASVSIGSGIKNMQQYVFSGCTALEEIVFPGTIPAINYGTFKGCFSLKRIIIGEGVRRISEGAFCKCYALEEVILPSSIQWIRPYAFSKCRKMKKLVLKSQETDISDVALYKCPEDLVIEWNSKSSFSDAASQGFDVDRAGTLVSYFGTRLSVMIPECVTSIGRFAAVGRHDITSVVLSNTVKTIGDNAFAFSYKLKRIEMPAVESIGQNVFWATGLTDVHFPASLTEAGKDIFGHCNELRHISFDSDHVAFKGRIAAMCYNLKDVILPKQQKYIPDMAFYYCESLKPISIPSTVKHIGDRAFIGCKSYEANWPDAKDSLATTKIKEIFSVPVVTPSGYIYLVDSEELVFADSRGCYYNEQGTQIEYITPISDEVAENNIIEEEKRRRAEHIAKDCSGLDSFSDTEIDWEIDDGFGHFGFKDQSGNVIIEPQYAWTGDFAHGLCPVNLNRTWYHTPEGNHYYENHYGYIDARGKTIIPFKFEEAHSFNKYGVAVVSDDTGTYMIDTTGTEIEGTRFPYIEDRIDYEDRYIEFCTDTAADNDDDNHTGLYDTKLRRILFQPLYEMFHVYDEDTIVATVGIPERRGDIREKLFNSRGRIKYSWTAHRDFAEIEPPDENGNFICARSTYREAVETQENDIYCFYKDGKTFERRFWFGLADADGNTLLPPEFEMIRYLGHGFYACEKGARTTVFKYQKQDLN